MKISNCDLIRPKEVISYWSYNDTTDKQNKGAMNGLQTVQDY